MTLTTSPTFIASSSHPELVSSGSNDSTTENELENQVRVNAYNELPVCQSSSIFSFFIAATDRLMLPCAGIIRS